MGNRILKVEYDDSQALSYDEVKALVTGNQQKRVLQKYTMLKSAIVPHNIVHLKWRNKK